MSQLSDLKRSGSAFKRPYKANLLVCGSDKIKEKRREQFLRKVERSRDDKTWETRGDQVCDACSRLLGVANLMAPDHANGLQSKT